MGVNADELKSLREIKPVTEWTPQSAQEVIEDVLAAKKKIESLSPGGSFVGDWIAIGPVIGG